MKKINHWKLLKSLREKGVVITFGPKDAKIEAWAPDKSKVFFSNSLQEISTKIEEVLQKNG